MEDFGHQEDLEMWDRRRALWEKIYPLRWNYLGSAGLPTGERIQRLNLIPFHFISVSSRTFLDQTER